MILAWRIAKRAHTNAAFSGEGARIAGGRWNLPGDAGRLCLLNARIGRNGDVRAPG